MACFSNAGASALLKKKKDIIETNKTNLRTTKTTFTPFTQVSLNIQVETKNSEEPEHISDKSSHKISNGCLLKTAD